MKDRILILGNGFDLDLGLKTSYKSFVESSYWPFQNIEHTYNYLGEKMPMSLNDALLFEKDSKSWFDIESALGRYACMNRKSPSERHNRAQAAKDRKAYETLVGNLRDYLREQQENASVKRESIAAEVLRAVIANGYFDNIYSFNYTDLNILARKIGINNKIPYLHMHGRLDTGIILGIESRMDFNPLYRFMCKEYSPYYQARQLIQTLNKADEVVFFGHSLSEIDYHYFQSFFRKQSEDILSPDDSKKITIFTHNLDSQWDICDQLRNMNDRRLDSLFGNNDFNIFRTSDCANSESYLAFIKYLRSTSRDAHTRIIRNLGI